jgi:phage regulator Rha-like protein
MRSIRGLGLLLLEDEMELMKAETITGCYGSVMDSREIAERTGKNHADVCRDIRKTLAELDLDESTFASVYKGGNGEDRRCYLLPKRECIILASGYSIKLRAAIIDRWTELEAQQPFQPAYMFPRSLSEALRFDADLQDKIEASARCRVCRQVRRGVRNAAASGCRKGAQGQRTRIRGKADRGRHTIPSGW